MTPPSVCLVSIPVQDLQKAYKFYQAVLGWEVARQLPTMWILQGPGETNLSLETGWEPSGPAGIQFFLKVEDPAACLKQAAEHGGEIVEKPVTIPDYGTYAIAEDPDGNRIGFHQPAA